MNPQHPTYPAFHEIAEWIQAYCNENVYQGAMLGFFNGNLAFATIKRDLNLADEDSTDARNVGKIVHEIHFSDFQQPKEIAPVDADAEIVIEARNDYDNLPPRHSRDYDMAQTLERNGYEIDDDA